MYHYFFILPSLGAALCLGLGIFTLSRNTRHPVNIGFALGMASLAVFETGAAITLFSYDGGAVAGLHILLIGEALAPVGWYSFTSVFGRANPEDAWRKRGPVFAGLILASLFFMAMAAAPGFASVSAGGDGAVYLSFGPMGKLFHSYMIIGVVLNLVQLENTLRSSSGIKRWRVKYIIFGSGAALAFFAYMASQALLFSALYMETLPAASVVIIVSASMMAVFIARHRLMEVDIFVSRYVVYNSVTVLLVGIYLLGVGIIAYGIKYFGVRFDYFFSASFVFVAFLLLAAIAFSASVRRKTQLFINRHFYRHKYEFRDMWMESVEKIGSQTSAGKTGETLVEMISLTMKPRGVQLWLKHDASGVYRSTGLGTITGFEQLDKNHPLAALMAKNGGPFLLDGAGGGIEDIAARTGAALCSPLIAADEVIGFVLLGRDISGEPYREDDFELLRALCAQAAIQIKNIRLGEDIAAAKEAETFSRMSSFIMHDLKNLTNSLSLISQNARDNISDPQFQKDAIGTINTTVARMKGLIEKLSAVRRGIDLRKKDVKLALLIEGALDRLPPGEGKDVKIIKKIEDLPRVMADPEAMEMVFYNILANARDAIAQSGNIIVAASVNGSHAMVTISDTGAGMPKDFMEKSLFAPFKTTKKTGFGIGLYQCKTIIEAHGGRIEAQSEEGKGTVFTITLPVNQAGGGL